MLDAHSIDLLQKHLKTHPIIIGQQSLRHDIDDLVAQALPPMRLCIVDDVNTEHALGAHIFKALKGKGNTKHLTLLGEAKANDATIAHIREYSKNSDALIAVGSGTISDLCKYASYLDNKPYIVFPTAASMNGYVSANASITMNGYKKTVLAHLPQAIFCDISVIAYAPIRLSKSGLGDSLARPTAQADWLLSHILLNTPYNQTAFDLLLPYEQELFDSARGIAKSDPASIALLIRTLLLSGFSMTIAGGSFPASQGEHMIAHTMEMLRSNHHKKPTLHGEEIAITTLTMSHIQENLLRNQPRIRINAFDEEKITSLFGEHVALEAKKEYQEKTTLIMQHGLHQDSAIKNWDHIATRLEKIIIPSKKMKAILTAGEIPITIESLDWDSASYNTSLTYARFLRNRFTALDLEA